jgi:hypothetical protein
MKGERDSLRSWPLSVLVEDEGVVARGGRGGFAVRNPPMDWHAFDAVVVGRLLLVSAGFVMCGAAQAFPCRHRLCCVCVMLTWPFPWRLLDAVGLCWLES